MEPDPLQSAIRDHLNNKEILEEAQRRCAESEKALIEQMQAQKIKSSEHEMYKNIYKVTYVQSSRYEINKEALKEYLGPQYWMYTRREFDKELIEKGMGSGDLDPSVVGQFIEERKSKPSVRISKRASDTPG